ncbi:esterase/lipase family protein [Streptomyces sp. LN549]|uniref:esterase/lipase family protein n=1 Tax=Streptomyces sp. LN549 TaxID=3112979 RepID=UPI003710845F
MTEQPQTNPPGRVPGGRPRTTPGLTPAVTHDAVVLVPGIMGSELYDTGTGKVLWGLAHPTWLAKAWLTKGGLAPLHLTAEEQAGDYGRIKARRLLQIPAWSPVLRGIEPYHKMTAAIENAVAHPAAVLPFPYDWRLPVEVNARRLASEARDHLERWRQHPAHAEARLQAVDEREARLVFVAHSMGGLVTYAALTLGYDSGLEADTRGVMTLGTPFHGSVVAANILNTAQGAPLPLPHSRLASLASAMPGVHDLLPGFLCVEEGLDVRRLTPSDVGALGGDKDLARSSQEFFDALRAKPFPHHRPVVGIRQETVQSMRLENGTVIASEYCFRTHTDGELMRDPDGAPRRFQVGGDGTVHRESASLTRRTVPLALQHGALASDRAARQAVVDFLLEDDHLGPDQADDGLGLTVPDYVVPNAEWTVRITGTDDPSGVDCTVAAVEGGFQREVSLYAGDDDALGADLEVPDAGLYRVTVEADYLPSPLTQLVFAGPGGTAPLDD